MPKDQENTAASDQVSESSSSLEVTLQNCNHNHAEGKGRNAGLLRKAKETFLSGAIAGTFTGMLIDTNT